MDGKFCGIGKHTFPDGTQYEGEFSDGHPKGQGTLKFPAGGKLVGEFRELNPWNAKEFNTEGKIVVEYNNGVAKKFS